MTLIPQGLAHFVRLLAASSTLEARLSPVFGILGLVLIVAGFVAFRRLSGPGGWNDDILRKHPWRTLACVALGVAGVALSLLAIASWESLGLASGR